MAYMSHICQSYTAKGTHLNKPSGNVALPKQTIFGSMLSNSIEKSYKYTSEATNMIAHKTSQELQMLSSVTINCQVTMIVMNSGIQVLNYRVFF